MPVYKLHCFECEAVFEKLVFSVKAPLECSCGSSDVEKLPTVAAFSLKGAGFHRNDYPSIDQKVGEDAENRWEHIHSRNDAKEKMRKNLKSDETIVREDGGGYSVDKMDNVPPNVAELAPEKSV